MFIERCLYDQFTFSLTFCCILGSC